MIDINMSLNLYKKMLLIRLVERAIQKYYHEDEMKTPMHMSMGGEAIAVGVCEAAGLLGHIFTSYRTHSVYLSKTNEVNNFFLEMYGKKNIIADGRAGSMHISAIDDGYIMSSAIVGSHIPVSIGYAFANMVKNNGIISVAFFGDGAIDEGVFWESINLACLMRLPVLFVFEDNGLAVHTPPSQRHGYNSFHKIIEQFQCGVYDCISTDVEKIYTTASLAIDNIRMSNMPSFIFSKYHRYLEHVGVKEDYDAGYRDIKEYQKFLEIDPVTMQLNRLLKMGFPMVNLVNMESDINRKIEEAISVAKDASIIDMESLCKDVYNEND
jgi:pyruvate dehydrogenase E1 component alpha subunit